MRFLIIVLNSNSSSSSIFTKALNAADRRFTGQQNRYWPATVKKSSTRTRTSSRTINSTSRLLMLPSSTSVARKRDPTRVRSVPLMFAIHPPESGIASEFENRTWKSVATLERFVERLHEIVDFFLANDQGRQNFDDIHVVAGDLRQNPMPTQEGDVRVAQRARDRSYA